MKRIKHSRNRMQNIVVSAFAVLGLVLIVSGLSDLISSDEQQQSVTASTTPAAQNDQTVQASQSNAVHDTDSALSEHWQHQQSLDSRQHYDEEVADAHLTVDLDSVAMISAHFNDTPAEQIDFDGIVNAINNSALAFDYIAEQYLSSDHDAAKNRVLLNALNNTSNPARINFALGLANSSDLALRQQAYSWLSYGKDSEDQGLAYQTLVDASYHEHDATALAQLVSSMPLHHFSDTPDLYERAIYRLNELAFHPDDSVSSEAIERISESVINQNTLSILQLHLQDTSESRQLAALQGLENVGNPNSELLSSLDAILHNPNLPQKHRAIAARIMIDFENQLSTVESL